MKWEWREQGPVNYLTLPEWNKQGVVTGFTSRAGGFSNGPFRSLNLGLHVGDDPDLVIANRELVSHSLGFAPERMVCCEQVHSNGVMVVHRDHAGRGANNQDDVLPGCDAMVTNCPWIFLTEFYADCYPLYFFDPGKRVIGLAHSGWKGTALRIAEAVINVISHDFGCRLRDIQVFIGPGIGPLCFGIDDDRKSQVERLFTFSDKIIYPNNENQYVWDLELTNRLIVKQSGIPEDNITSCHLCTACNQERFFSYRGSGGHTGRMAAVLGLID